jgi:hypothetical protein
MGSQAVAETEQGEMEPLSGKHLCHQDCPWLLVARSFAKCVFEYRNRCRCSGLHNPERNTPSSRFFCGLVSEHRSRPGVFPHTIRS